MGAQEATTQAQDGAAPRVVVGVGASAGGLEALQAFFAAVPVDAGAAYVVLQHIAPDFKSVMGEILSRFTTLPIHVAESGMALRRNAIYLLPPSAEMIVAEGRLLLRDREDSHGVSLPIDVFFRSLATCYGPHAVGVVLSGTGHDGSRGAQAIAAAGGTVVCQAPETAAFDGMPRSALATGVVAASLPPDAVPAFLFDPDADQAGVVPAPDGADEEALDPELAPVFALLGERFGVDFGQYRTGTVARRIDRRMRQRGCRTVEHYARVLAAEPAELQSLYEDFLIGVTEFFRDDEVWQALAEQVLDDLVARVGPDRELRAWVVGTATGEEAYTVAMLLHEAAERCAEPPSIRVFATDLHPGSIEVAGRGVYPVTAVEHLDPVRRARWFVPLDADRVQVTGELRRLVVFARHDVISEPPFMKLDLISCRNMLIYLQPRAQQRVMSLLLFALRREGCLVLGSSEGVGVLDEELAPVDRRLKIFTKRRDSVVRPGIAPNRVPAQASRLGAVPTALARTSAPWGWEQWLVRAYDSLLDEYAPDAILVDAAGSVVHTFGSASEFLLPPSGRTTASVDALVRPELRQAVATGLQRVSQGGRAAAFGGITVRLPSGDRVVEVRVRPVDTGRRERGYLVLVEDRTPAHRPAGADDDASSGAGGPAADGALDASAAEHVEYLQAELRYAREQVQATVEELEASNEELQASNEELVASNEELQSSNEELHSVNEELYTVNREYEDSIEQLTQLAGDLDNLMRCTEIGTVFVDAQLRIRRYTPAATRHVNLLPGDVGRPLVHLNRNVDAPDLDSQLRAVLADGVGRQQEVRHVDGSWWLMRVHPYRSEGGETTGVVVTWVDVQQLRTATAQVATRGERLQSFAHAVAHELAQPLRMLVSFTDLFERRSRDLAHDPTALGYLDEVRQSAARVNAMLDALLVYSRVHSRGGPLVPTSLDELVAEVVRERCAARLAETGGRVDVAPLGAVLADPPQVARLVAELVHNAVDHGGQAPPRIEVTARPGEGGMLRVEVRDHGVGVDDRRADEAFRMFGRLDGDGEDEHLGVGLAIAQRLVERHGGQIGLGRHPQGGCLAWFTLPLAEALPPPRGPGEDALAATVDAG